MHIICLLSYSLTWEGMCTLKHEKKNNPQQNLINEDKFKGREIFLIWKDYITFFSYR